MPLKPTAGIQSSLPRIPPIPTQNGKESGYCCPRLRQFLKAIWDFFVSLCPCSRKSMQTKQVQTHFPKTSEISKVETVASSQISTAASSKISAVEAPNLQVGPTASVPPVPSTTLAMSDTEAERIANLFFQKRNKNNSFASFRNEAFEADLDNFTKQHPRVQDYILATIVVDGVMPDRIKTHYEKYPSERPTDFRLRMEYDGIPPAFRLHIARLSPKRQAAFNAQFGTVDLEKCSDEQAQSMSTFFKTGLLGVS